MEPEVRSRSRWHLCPQEQKAMFNARSAAEFQAQHHTLMKLGLCVRTLCSQRKDQSAKSQTSSAPAASADSGDGPGEKFQIGSFVAHGGSAASILGGGTYGKVFAARCAQGRLCAVKVFRSGHAEEEAKTEIEKYKKLSQLPAVHRRWFPELLDFDASSQPWPGIARNQGLQHLIRQSTSGHNAHCTPLIHHFLWRRWRPVQQWILQWGCGRVRGRGQSSTGAGQGRPSGPSIFGAGARGV